MTIPAIQELFHPLVAEWFHDSFPSPTLAQEMAWPPIAEGENVLVVAPTGSGKTLTAFLVAIDRLVKGQWQPGATRVLYVSPLRALNNDIFRNLKLPLAGIRDVFDRAGEKMPLVRTATRSGDTPESERREMIRRPPEILITTPESLNILLTSKRGRSILGDLKTVILDEVHAVAGAKRGTHLITAVERLTRLSGEFQRIALSATVNPAKIVASWVAGYRLSRRGGQTAFEPRPIRVVDTAQKKKFSLSIHLPPVTEDRDQAAQRESGGESPVWQSVAKEVASRIDQNRSTLVFGNSRRTVERLARLINRAAEGKRVFAHHGSLSREIREIVEARLKEGELSGIVATNSLELGIDIGSIDEVVMVESPGSVASTVQRLGRSGHGVGETSRGRIYAVHSRDLIQAAINIQCVRSGEVEPVRIPENPLDILAQVVLSMTANEQWSVPDLLDFLRTMHPYHHLSSGHFQLVIDMLTGKYAGVRIPALRPRLRVDRVENTAQAKPGTDRLIYAAGGTIPDRGYFTLRAQENGVVLGTLDEEFVWERSVGDTFTLGVQSWRIQSISHSDVFVVPSGSRRTETPFWTSEERASEYWFAKRRGAFLERANAVEDSAVFVDILKREYFFDEAAALDLARFLNSQKQHTGCDLPHAHHVVIEKVKYPEGTGPENTVVIHTTWGGRVNRPFAIALAQAIGESYGKRVPYVVDEDCIALELPEPMGADQIFAHLEPERIEGHIRNRLEAGGFFGAQFREAAQRSLLLPRAGFKTRTPLWLSRKRSKELREMVANYNDFPILLEAWRTCLQDEMDIPNLLLLLEEVAVGAIAWSEVTTQLPSPMAREVVWKNTNELMYERDDADLAKSPLRQDLIAEVMFSSELRPSIPREIVSALEAKLKRVYSGYSPRNVPDLVDWVLERVLLPAREWWDLLAAMERDHALTREAIFEDLGDKIVGVGFSPDQPSYICSVEHVHRVERSIGAGRALRVFSPLLDGRGASKEAEHALKKLELSAKEDLQGGDDRELFTSFLAEWLRYYGPLTLGQISSLLSITRGHLEEGLVRLAEDNRVVIDKITSQSSTDDGPEPSEVEICDVDTLAQLLRLTRHAARTEFEPLESSALPLLWATQHKLGMSGDTETLKNALERLFGFAAPPHLWEEEFLPARVHDYKQIWLDQLFAETNLIWLGFKRQKTAFVLEGDTELFLGSSRISANDRKMLTRVFPRGPGRYTVGDLLSRGEFNAPRELIEYLWSLCWSGLVSSDSFSSIRQGIESGFRTQDAKAEERTGSPRRQFAKWKSRHSILGNWFVLERNLEAGDPLAEEELRRDRVRVLIKRYGILFRELLSRELPELRWAELFRTLRLLELSGELIGGCFFRDLNSLQFISPAALTLLKKGLPKNAIYWMNAADPISPCGLGLSAGELPRRLPANHLVFRGKELVVVSRGRCKNLEIRIDPNDPDLAECLRFIEVLLSRHARPLRGVVIERINGNPASSSPYCDKLRQMFDVDRDYKSVRLCRRY